MSDDLASLPRLPRDWFARSTLAVARELIGCWLVSKLPEGLAAGRIIETEGYLGPADPASHSAMYRTERVAIMAREPGFAYVYRSYGIHAMLNVVAKPPGETGGVLIRAALPLVGLELMARRRGLATSRLLAAGPGRLAEAFGITLADHGTDLVTSDRLWLAAGEPLTPIAAGPRIGITRAVDRPWRFFLAGSPFVSGPRRLHPPAEAGDAKD